MGGSLQIVVAFQIPPIFHFHDFERKSIRTPPPPHQLKTHHVEKKLDLGFLFRPSHSWKSEGRRKKNVRDWKSFRCKAELSNEKRALVGPGFYR